MLLLLPCWPASSSSAPAAVARRSGSTETGDRAEQSASQVEPPRRRAGRCRRRHRLRSRGAGDAGVLPAGGDRGARRVARPSPGAHARGHAVPESSLPQLMGSYDKSWGALLGKTRPTVGNHEYYTPARRATTATSRTAARASRLLPAQRRRLEDHVLNSNCTKVSCAEQAAWMDRKMKAYPAKCSIVTMHHPRYSSGSEHGNNTAVKPLWASPTSTATTSCSPATTTTTSGSPGWTGWATPSQRHAVVRRRDRRQGPLPARHPEAGSRYFQAEPHGVLALDLRQGSFGWKFHGDRRAGSGRGHPPACDSCV